MFIHMSNVDAACGPEGLLRKDSINKFTLHNWCARHLTGVFGASCSAKHITSYKKRLQWITSFTYKTPAGQVLRINMLCLVLLAVLASQAIVLAADDDETNALVSNFSQETMIFFLLFLHNIICFFSALY